MSDELGPLPEPLNLSPLPRLIVLGHTPAQMRAYAAQEVARERERWIGLVRTAEGWLRDAGMDDEAAQLEAGLRDFFD
jgi:hypothetical protein